MVATMCNNLNSSDVIVEGTGILSMSGRCDALGPSTNIEPQSSFTSNRTHSGIFRYITLHYVCCEHLGSKIKLHRAKGISELPLKPILSHSSTFK